MNPKKKFKENKWNCLIVCLFFFFLRVVELGSSKLGGFLKVSNEGFASYLVGLRNSLTDNMAYVLEGLGFRVCMHICY